MTKASPKKSVGNKIFKAVLGKIIPENNRLPSLDEVLKITRSKNRVYLGIKEIQVSKIIGSEGRYSDFDHNFLPNNDNLKHRLGTIRNLYEEGHPFPPISVFKIDDYYFVRDGNHRVAVAKSRGQLYIDAEVTEYILDVPITQDLTLADRVLIQEHSDFLEDTGLVKFGRDAIINMTKPESYSELLKIIKKYIEIQNFKASQNLDLEKGAAQWYQKIFLPFAEDAYRFDMLSRFPGRTTGDLYVWLQKNWNKLDSFSSKEELGYMLIGGEGLHADNPISQKELRILKEIYSKNLRVEKNFLLEHHIALSVIIVLIYIDNLLQPKIIIARRKYHPNEGRWSLPISMLRVDEELIDATKRCQNNVLGISKPLDLIPFCVRDKKERLKFGRAVGFGYLGIVYDIKRKMHFTAGHLAASLQIVEVNKAPDLVYDHRQILELALKFCTENANNYPLFLPFFGERTAFKEIKDAMQSICDSYRKFKK